MRILDVFLDGRETPAGILASLDNGSTIFQYADDYFSDENAVPLSLSLPPRPDPFEDIATRAFFENLLPENDQMRRVIDLHGIDRSDFVGLLQHLGADCPGALSCVPHGSGPVKNPGILATDYDLLDLDTLTDFVQRMSLGQSLPDEIRDPSPVAGYQQKIALTLMPGGRFALPRIGTGAPTTHILKTPQIRDARDAELERTAAQMAAQVGLSVAIPEVLVLEGHPSILIERYDRTVHDGVVRRIHQEDFAQALGLPASLKYERRGSADRSFNSAGAYSLLQRTKVPAKTIREFIKLTIFNAIIGNADNHAKNHSLLYVGGPSPNLAPAYDLLPTRLNPNLHPEMGFRIGQAKTVEEVTAQDIALLLTIMGFSEAAALRFAGDEIASLMLALDVAAGGVVKDWDDMIGANLETCSAAFGLNLNLRDRDSYQAIGGGWISGS